MTKMPAMFLLAVCAIDYADCGPPLRAAEIRHRFLAVDESRGQLLYVDQSDASKDWTLKLSVKHRDLQLVGGNRVLLSTPDGYREYDLADRRLVKEVKVCNWTGHGAQDSSKGVQILQYNTAGQLVWKWHDPARAGTINGVIMMDDLDPAVLNDDASSVLGPVR